MAFGSKAGANIYAGSNGTTIGGKTDDLLKAALMPSGEGNFIFRLLPEDEEVFQVWNFSTFEGGKGVMINGKATYRSVVVSQDNIFHLRNQEQSEGLEKEEVKALKLKWAAKRFAMNVLFRGDENHSAGVRILQGSWNKQNVDSEGRIVKVEGTSFYAELLNLNGVVKDTTGKKPRDRRVDEFDIRMSARGLGTARRYKLNDTQNFDPLTPEELALPRYDLVNWIKDSTWNNEALEELDNGEDFYKTAEKYGINLIPQLVTRENVF